MFDMLICDGRVIDPSQEIDEVMDLAVAGGQIAALGKNLPREDVKRTINAEGRIVTPGLIDLHTHVYEGVSHYGVNADQCCLKKGVTTCLDVGSAGADTFTGFKKFIVAPSQTRILALLNLSVLGMVSERAGELEDLRYADVDYAVKTIRGNRDIIVGLKVRMERDFVAANAAQVLQLARETADAAGCFTMYHTGATAPSMAAVLAAARPGDVITHTYHSRPEGILNADGKIIPEVREAAERGVIFDVGHGRGSFSYEIARRALEQGLKPHTISSDLHVHDLHGPVYDLPTTMSKFLYLGLPLAKVVAMCTSNPAKVMGRGNDIGTLRVGAAADVAVLKMHDDGIELTDAGWDKPKETVTADRYLTVSAVLRGGRLIS